MFGGKESVQITGAWQSGSRPGARLCYISCCVSRQNHYLSIVRINSFRPSAGRSATEGQSCVFNVKKLSQFAVAGGGGVRRAKKSFHLGPNLMSAALGIYGTVLSVS